MFRHQVPGLLDVMVTVRYILLDFKCLDTCHPFPLIPSSTWYLHTFNLPCQHCSLSYSLLHVLPPDSPLCSWTLDTGRTCVFRIVLDTLKYTFVTPYRSALCFASKSWFWFAHSLHPPLLFVLAGTLPDFFILHSPYPGTDHPSVSRSPRAPSGRTTRSTLERDRALHILEPTAREPRHLYLG